MSPIVVPQDTVHATCVAFHKRGLLILGPSGSGKSTLGLALMALGAKLIADDRTTLTNKVGTLVAKCPPAIRGLIEARGLGLIRAETQASTKIALVVDLGQTEMDRLPPFRHTSLCGVTCDLVLGQQTPHFPSFLLAYMKGGRQA
jgi:HPr kinase/phosphorylase